METIATIRNDFDTKFGVPRQSGLVMQARSLIVFEPRYRVAEALRGIEGWSHLWLIWRFHQIHQTDWSPTVRPPRLGGNTRLGVFATRSPFRPNPLGLSCVRLEQVQDDEKLGRVLVVSGADLVSGTPILDIKPYLPYADCHPEAASGFTAEAPRRVLQVVCPPQELVKLPEDSRDALLGVLSQDPRPAYQEDPERVYGFSFAGHEVRFRVAEGVLTVASIS